MRVILNKVFLIFLLSAGLTALIDGMWDRLPWCRYRATNELSYVVRTGGVVRHAYDAGFGGSKMQEQLMGMRDVWLSSAFRENLVCRMKNKVPSLTHYVEGCDLRIDLQTQRACVIVCVESPSREAAAAFADAAADEIVTKCLSEEAGRRGKAVSQILNNCARKEKHIKRLELNLEQSKTNLLLATHVKTLGREIASERKTLVAMQHSASALSNALEWGNSFERLPHGKDNVVVVRPNLFKIWLVPMTILTAILMCFNIHQIVGKANRLLAMNGDQAGAGSSVV